MKQKINREWWFSQPFVLHNLRDQLRYTYLSAIKKNAEGETVLTRYYLGYTLSLLQDSLKRLGALKDNSVKLYFDLAIWKDENGNTPLFSYNQETREKEKDRFGEEYKKYFKGYSFAIDIDSDKDVMTAWRDAKKIKELFDTYKLPYSLKFSGGRGFHFLIEDKWFNKRMKPSNKVIFFGRMAGVIMNVCRLKSHKDGGTFDDSIYDDRRIFKLESSLNYKDGKEYVCLALDNEQFKNWKLEDMELNNVVKNIRLFKRGRLTRTHNLSEKELKGNVVKFVKEIIGK